MSGVVGKGNLVASGDDFRPGRFKAIRATRDLIEIMDDGDDQLVVHITSPNVTMIAPIYERLAGVICETGDEMAHVAIVTRELGVPCLVQAEVTVELDELEGRILRLDPDGNVWIHEDQAGEDTRVTTDRSACEA